MEVLVRELEFASKARSYIEFGHTASKSSQVNSACPYPG